MEEMKNESKFDNGILPISEPYFKVDMCRWVKIKDRLPEIGQIVLIFTKHGIFMDYIDHPKDGNLWAFTDKQVITHWMPLPDAPKQDN